jgi:hypothetical protein
MELLGSDYREVGKIVEGIANAKPQEDGVGAEQVSDGAEPATSNQNGVEQSSLEESIRSMV